MRASLVSIPQLSEAFGGERIGYLNFKVTKPSKEIKGKKLISNRELDTAGCQRCCFQGQQLYSTVTQNKSGIMIKACRFPYVQQPYYKDSSMQRGNNWKLSLQGFFHIQKKSHSSSKASKHYCTYIFNFFMRAMKFFENFEC